MSADELRDAIAQCIADWHGWPDEVDEQERDLAGALLDGPLRQTVRLARSGACAQVLAKARPDEYSSTREWAAGYNTALNSVLLAAGAVPEPEPT